MKQSKYNVFYDGADLSYVYNLLHRSFLLIPKNIIRAIKEEKFENISAENINVLNKQGILLPDDVDEKYVFHDLMNSALTSKNVLGIFLSMTSGCNFSCPYCYQDYRNELQNKKYISKENIDIIYKFIIKENVRELRMVYFGGEPTLNEDILVYAIEKFNSLEMVNVTNTIITNGYNISENFINKIKLLKNWAIQITLDGTKEKHDKSRRTKAGKGTFDKIYNNVIKIARIKPHGLFLRVNVDMSNLKPYYELVDLLEKDGLCTKILIWFEPIFDGQKKKNCNVNINENELNELREYADKKGCIQNYTVEYGPCMSRARNGLAIDENLNTYCCAESLYQKTVGKINYEGEHIITDNDWYEKIYKIKDCVYTCKYGPICYGGCEMNNKCRREQIESMIPIVLKHKIENYNKEVT